MERDLRQQFEEAVSEKTIDTEYRRGVVQGANLQDLLMRGTSMGVTSLIADHPLAAKLNEGMLLSRAQMRISAAMGSLVEIRNPETRREHAVGLMARCVAEVAFEMVAHGE